MFNADARLDNRGELGAMLSISAAELAVTSDSTLLLRLYRRWGDLGIARCLGAFAFALWEPDKRRLVLGRDCLGNRALFFHHGGGLVTFATTLNALLALPAVPRKIDDIAVANYLALNLTQPSQTLYRGIERVPSRTLVTITPQGTNHRHYWAPDFDAPPPYRRDEDYVERARELLDQAVATATADTPRVAISASGGLDSSAIAATAARLGRAESITCYCAVPPQGMELDIGPDRYLDERDKIEALARMHPALSIHFCVEGDLQPFEEDANRFFLRTGSPIRNPSTLGAFSLITDQIAASGSPAMLVGNRGNFGLTWTGQNSLLALLRQNNIETLVRDFSAIARQGRRGILRTLVGEILLPAAPQPLRRLLTRLRGRDPDSVERLSGLNPTAIADMDLARRWRKDGFDPWFGHGGWSPARYRAGFLFDHNQPARDYYAQSQSIYGFETRDPHADRRLLEFLLAVPEPMYRRDGVPRSFARAVLADRLPREILDERRKGYQAATWFRRLDVRRPAIAAEIERLEASPLASRLLDVPRLKRILANWPKDENAAEVRRHELQTAFGRGIHVGRFIRWVEGGNA